MITGNDVYNMIMRPEGKSVLSSIWIYKNKFTKQGSWFVSERIYYGMTYSNEQTNFSNKAEVYIEQRTTCADKALYELRRHPKISTSSYTRSLKIT